MRRYKIFDATGPLKTVQEVLVNRSFVVDSSKGPGEVQRILRAFVFLYTKCYQAVKWFVVASGRRDARFAQWVDKAYGLHDKGRTAFPPLDGTFEESYRELGEYLDALASEALQGNEQLLGTPSGRDLLIPRMIAQVKLEHPGVDQVEVADMVAHGVAPKFRHLFKSVPDAAKGWMRQAKAQAKREKREQSQEGMGARGEWDLQDAGAWLGDPMGDEEWMGGDETPDGGPPLGLQGVLPRGFDLLPTCK